MVRARTAYKSVSFQVICLASSCNFAFVPACSCHRPDIDGFVFGNYHIYIVTTALSGFLYCLLSFFSDLQGLSLT